MIHRPGRDPNLWETTRVYLPTSRCAHLLPAWAGPDDGEPALCGVLPPLRTAWGAHGGWYGTGTWTEQQHAKQLPTCLNCERARRGRT